MKYSIRLREFYSLIVIPAINPKTLVMYKLLIIFFVIGSCFFHKGFAQKLIVEMPLLEQSVSNFSLIDQTGKTIELDNLRGKNVMLVFPRGMVEDDHWCQICHYQYAELVEFEKNLSFRNKYNMEVYFVLPYSKDSVQGWINMFPKQMEIIQGWKNPDPENSTERALNWSKRARQILPKDFSAANGGIEISFPVLVDSEQVVSKGFKLFDISDPKAPQNKPAIYIIDAKGKLKFKYVSQNTFDRPPYEYLFNIIEKVVL